jgi:peptide chain release factor 1
MTTTHFLIFGVERYLASGWVAGLVIVPPMILLLRVLGQRCCRHCPILLRRSGSVFGNDGQSLSPPHHYQDHHHGDHHFRRALSLKVSTGRVAAAAAAASPLLSSSTLLSPALVRRVQELLQAPNPDNARRKLGHLERERQSALEEVAIMTELQREAAAVENDDAEAVQSCREELQTLYDAIRALELQIVDALLAAHESSSDNDGGGGGTDAIIEIRAGTGGDEASLFAQELMDCYRATAKRYKFQVELLSETYTALGGIRESSVSITAGSSSSSSHQPADSITPYEFFRFESGVHRVQRVPVNDVKIQTSACSVAILPQQAASSSDHHKNAAVDVINPADLFIETMRAQGAGGQHVNTTDSAVRITHLPTGTTVSIQDERSQHKNKKKALKLIGARVRDARQRAVAAARFQQRSSLLGGGDRSERIRTFNFPQDRVTDHRCKETRHGIVNLMGGGGNINKEDKEDGLVATFLPYLRALRRDELLKEIEQESNTTNK